MMQSKGGLGRLLHYCGAKTVSFGVRHAAAEEDMDVIQDFRRIAVIVLRAGAQDRVTDERAVEIAQKGIAGARCDNDSHTRVAMRKGRCAR